MQNLNFILAEISDLFEHDADKEQDDKVASLFFTLRFYPIIDINQDLKPFHIHIYAVKNKVIIKGQNRETTRHRYDLPKSQSVIRKMILWHAVGNHNDLKEKSPDDVVSFLSKRYHILNKGLFA